MFSKFFCIINQNLLYELSFLFSSASIFLGKSSVTIYLSTKVGEPLSSDLFIHPPWKIQGEGIWSKGSAFKFALLAQNLGWCSTGMAKACSDFLHLCAWHRTGFLKVLLLLTSTEKRRVSFRNVSWKKNMKFAKFLLF